MHLFVLQGELPETFFQVLVESLKVEALIGLRDALEPESLVPVPGPTSAPPAEALPQDASGTAAESSQDAEDTSLPCRYCPYSLSGGTPIPGPRNGL